MAKNTLGSKTTTKTNKSTATKTVKKTEPVVTEEAKTTETVESTSADILAEAMTQAMKVVANTASQQKTKETGEYAPTDAIPCRSVTEGRLILVGSKSGIEYNWGGFNDITEVEYQDLQFLKARKSDFLYKPCFVIEDQELLETSRFKDLKETYETMYTIEMDDFCNLPNNRFEAELKKLPSGLQDAVKTHVMTQIQADEFDSIQKIKIIDNVLGTDLLFLVK